MANILVVEDERPINQLICRSLSLVGHQCTSAYSGQEARTYAAKTAFDLIVMDVMLPDTDGFVLFTQLKPIPTIFLTAKGALTDRLKGLNLGADDYIVKPFEMQELLARINVVLRRSGKLAEHFVLDDTEVDLSARLVSVQGKNVDLTPQESALLEALIQNRNIALSREQILSIAWGIDYYGDDRTVDVHIQKLRKKLLWDKRIKTVYKLGYRLETQP